MWEQIWHFLGDRLPTVGFIAVIIMVGAAREVWVWGHVYRRQIAETLYWRDKALDALGLGELAVGVASDIAEEQGR